MDSVANLIVENAWQIATQLPTELQEFLLLSTSLVSLGDNLVPDSPNWIGNSTGILSLREAWNLLRRSAAVTPWSGLIWNKFLNPRLAYLI